MCILDDHSRVKLDPCDDDDADYINANWIMVGVVNIGVNIFYIQYYKMTECLVGFILFLAQSFCEIHFFLFILIKCRAFYSCFSHTKKRRIHLDT